MNERARRNGRRPSRRSLWRVAVVVGAAVLGFLLGVTPALAHAVLVSSFPEDGATVAGPPTQVQLTFDESVQLISGVTRSSPQPGCAPTPVIRS